MTRGWFKRIKSILTLGGIGAAFTGLAAGAWTLLSGIASGYLMGEQVLASVLVWGFFGGFSVTGFATALWALRSRRQLHDISLFWTALVGGVMGALAPLAVSVFIGGSWIPLLSDLPILGGFAALGAGLTTGIVVIAQRSSTTSLDAASPASKLIE